MKPVPALRQTLHIEGIWKPFSMSFRGFHWVSDLVHCSPFCFIRYEIRCFILIIIIAAKWTFAWLYLMLLGRQVQSSKFISAGKRQRNYRGHFGNSDVVCFYLPERSPIKGRMREEWRKVGKWFQKTIICRLATYVNSLPLSGKTIHMRNQPRASDRPRRTGGRTGCLNSRLRP